MSAQYDHLIQAAAEKWLPGYDWRLLKAQYIAESGLNPLAVSEAGAQGIAQFMPASWGEWSQKSGHAPKPPTDPQAAIETGACYMAYLIGQWKSPRPDADRWCLAMASYNAGLGNVLKAQKQAKMLNGYKEIISALPTVTGEKSKETVSYVRKIFRVWAESVTG